MSFSKESRAFDLTKSIILVDANEFEGVRIAARILSEDFGRVTRKQANDVLICQDTPQELKLSTEVAIIVGCIESSPLLQHLEQTKKSDFSSIRGKWESFCTSVVENPVDGCQRALVIAGSDKRGAIYGLYTLSEQIGVSPYVFILFILILIILSLSAQPFC